MAVNLNGLIFLLFRSVLDQVKELPYKLSYEFPRQDITMIKVVGSGNFEEVWEAMAEGKT